MLRCARHLFLILAATLAAASAAVAQGSRSAGECGPSKVRVETVVNEQTATPERALRVRLEPTARFREALGGEGETPVRLCLRVQRPPQGVWKGLRVFLNAPDADARTQTSSPHYVGSVAFYGGTVGDSQSFMLNLGRAVRRLKQAGTWPASGSLTVTIVPIPSTKSTAIAGVGIRVEKVSLAVPE